MTANTSNMMPSTRRVARHLALATAIGLLIGAWELSGAPVGSAAHLTDRFGTSRGQSTTLLSDGRLLLLGGEDDNGSVVATGWLQDVTGERTLLASHLRHARAWHTATVLPDGTVLILGGLERDGTLVRGAERFNPRTGAFTARAVPLTPRAGHSATLLTDGRLLVVGGIGADGRALATAELWDVAARARTAVAIEPLDVARYAQTAALGADGTVLLMGGFGTDGQELADGEVYDPTTASFVRADGDRPPSQPPARVEASLPADGDQDAPLDRPLSVRFSVPVDVSTLAGDAVVLNGPEGAIAIQVVAAESGRLMFVSPRHPLAAATTYVLSITDLRDASGDSIAPVRIQFMTATAPAAKGAPASPSAQSGAPTVAQASKSRGNDSSGGSHLLGGESADVAAPATPLQAPPGVTAMSGQVLQVNGKPLAGVTLQIEDHVTMSDADGRFLLTGLTCAPRCALLIDGTTANRPRHTYGEFDLGFGVVVGFTTVLPFPLWMPELDTAHAIDIPSPTTAEVVLRNPRIPGLEVHLPPGTVIRDRNGDIVTRVTMTAIPNNRPPMPLPPWYEVPLVFTLQPGGAHIETPAGTGARIVYPNLDHLRARQRVKYTTYEPQHKDWFVYGLGRVTDDGTQIVPDQGVTFDTFRCSLQNAGDVAPDDAPISSDDPQFNSDITGADQEAADPVDVATGLFNLRKTDLIINDVIPISVTRSYQTEDTGFYHFGVGMQHAYEVYLFSSHEFTDVDLIWPDGGRVHYVRISSGDGFADAIFENEDHPTAFYKSRITWNGRGWDLTLRDGTVYVFGVNAHLLAIRDRNNNQVTITRQNDTFGRITRVTSPSGRFLDFTYNTAPHPVITQVTDNIGRTVSYAYDGLGYLQTVSGPDPSYTITYSYGQPSPTGLLRMIRIKDARQIVFLQNTFDLPTGRVLLQTQANGGTYTFAYTLDGQGNITATTATDPRGINRRIALDTHGRVTSVTRASGLPEAQTTTYTRDPISELVTGIQDARGRLTKLDRDALGNVVAITRLADEPPAQQTKTTFVYEPEPRSNLVHTVTDPLNHATTFTHDAHGNLTAITDPLTHATTMAYDNMGLLISRTDALHNQTQYVHQNGALTAVIDPLGNVERHLVDGVGRTVAVTDALGRTRRVVYDAADRLSVTADPLGGSLAYSYDQNRDLISITDARHNVTTYTQGTMEQLTHITNPLGGDASFNYDNAVTITTFTDELGEHNDVQYDELGRRIAVNVKRSGSITSPTYESGVAYQYDNGNRLVEVDDSDGGTLVRDYDDLDRLTSEAQCPVSPPCPDRTVTYAYDAAGRRTQLVVPNLYTATYTWDDGDRLVSIAGSTFLVEFVYDDANRRIETRIRPTGAGSGNRIVYSYDNDSRVTSIQYYRSNGTGWVLLGDLVYTYDSVGNRTSIAGSWARVAVPVPFTSASYNAANHIASVDGTAFVYDANGRLLSDGVQTYQWNPRNQLAVVTAPGLSTQFGYDAFGRRTVVQRNDVGVQYLYDGENPIVEQAATGPARFMVTGLGIDEYFLRRDENGMSTILSDALRSTVALGDTSGTIRTTYSYDGFGTTTSSGRASTNPIQYAGRENDQNGLYYNRARYYNPTVARFISADPLSKMPRAINLVSYSVANGGNNDTYANDRPTDVADPLGLSYVDANITVPVIPGVVVTGGLMVNGDGIYPYLGGGAGTPGGSITVSNADPSPGVNLQYQYISADGEVFSYTYGPDGYSGEVGGGTPGGGSVTTYYVFPPIAWPGAVDVPSDVPEPGTSGGRKDG